MTREWGWLKGGIALGLLSAFAFLTYSGLGTSTSYPRTVALLLNPVFPEWVANNAYFQRVAPVVDWQLLLVIGIALGGFLASRVVRGQQSASCELPVSGGQSLVATGRGAGQAEGDFSPSEDGAGTKAASQDVVFVDAQPVAGRRKWMAFVGGFLLLFGARLAGGCTSGHIITGMTQLATASFLFAAVVFAVGIPVAKFINSRGAA